MEDTEKNSKKDASKEELQNKLAFEISQTDYWIRKVYNTAPNPRIQKQVEVILQKLQSLQKKVDEAFQQENRPRT